MESITLPNNGSIKLLAMTEVMPPTNPQATLCPTTLGQATTFYATVNTSISGTVFNDNNMDGVYDSGDTARKVDLFYVDLNNSGQFAATDPSATTDATGAYRIFDLFAQHDLHRPALPEPHDSKPIISTHLLYYRPSPPIPTRPS